MVIGNRFVGVAPTAAFKGKIGPQNWYFRNFYCTHTVLSNENPAGNRGLSVSPGFPRFWAHLPIHPLRHFSIQSDARLVVDEAADFISDPHWGHGCLPGDTGNPIFRFPTVSHSRYTSEEDDPLGNGCPGNASSPLEEKYEKEGIGS